MHLCRMFECSKTREEKKSIYGVLKEPYQILSLNNNFNVNSKQIPILFELILIIYERVFQNTNHTDSFVGICSP